MIKTKNFTLREYQQEIFKTTKQNNTLICLPTGTGKTKIAIKLAVNRLNKFPNSKIAMCTPTKPLSSQIQKEFISSTNILTKKITLLTGQITPKKRTQLYSNSKIIIATPQTLKQDLLNNRFSFKEFSALIIDEAHRAIGNYAYTYLTKKYLEQSDYPRILALTASPGGTRKKIQEIKQNLFIDAIEIRTEKEIQNYLQKKKIRWIKIELQQELKNLHSLIKSVYKKKLKELKKFGLTKPTSLVTKKDILKIQQNFKKEIENKNPFAFYGISLTAQLLKLDHSLELLETQSLSTLNLFFNKLKQEQTRAAKTILKEPKINKAIKTIKTLIKKNITHPKLIKLKQIVKNELKQNPNSKIIIFANYRNTVKEIVSALKPIAKPKELLGQKQGITQKQQLQTIKDFENNTYNILIGTQVLEEGLDTQAQIAIFYDIVSSELRKVQRSGRVGRTRPGKIIFLITKSTRDEAYYWSSFYKEKIMKKTLKQMQQIKENQITLSNY